MSYKKFRWSQVYESSEEELVSILEARDLPLNRVHFDFGDSPKAQQHKAGTTVWCAEGSLKITVDNTTLPLQSGDAINLKLKGDHLITPGIAGCAYYVSD